MPKTELKKAQQDFMASFIQLRLFDLASVPLHLISFNQKEITVCQFDLRSLDVRKVIHLPRLDASLTQISEILNSQTSQFQQRFEYNEGAYFITRTFICCESPAQTRECLYRLRRTSTARPALPPLVSFAETFMQSLVRQLCGHGTDTLHALRQAVLWDLSDLLPGPSNPQSAAIYPPREARPSAETLRERSLVKGCERCERDPGKRCTLSVVRQYILVLNKHLHTLIRAEIDSRMPGSGIPSAPAPSPPRTATSTATRAHTPSPSPSPPARIKPEPPSPALISRRPGSIPGQGARTPSPIPSPEASSLLGPTQEGISLEPEPVLFDLDTAPSLVPPSPPPPSPTPATTTTTTTTTSTTTTPTTTPAPRHNRSPSPDPLRRARSPSWAPERREGDARQARHEHGAPSTASSSVTRTRPPIPLSALLPPPSSSPSPDRKPTPSHTYTRTHPRSPHIALTPRDALPAVVPLEAPRPRSFEVDEEEKARTDRMLNQMLHREDWSNPRQQQAEAEYLARLHLEQPPPPRDNWDHQPWPESPPSTRKHARSHSPSPSLSSSSSFSDSDSESQSHSHTFSRRSHRRKGRHTHAHPHTHGSKRARKRSPGPIIVDQIDFSSDESMDDPVVEDPKDMRRKNCKRFYSSRNIKVISARRAPEPHPFCRSGPATRGRAQTPGEILSDIRRRHVSMSEAYHTQRLRERTQPPTSTHTSTHTSTRTTTPARTSTQPSDDAPSHFDSPLHRPPSRSPPTQTPTPTPTQTPQTTTQTHAHKRREGETPSPPIQAQTQAQTHGPAQRHGGDVLRRREAPPFPTPESAVPTYRSPTVLDALPPESQHLPAPHEQQMDAYLRAYLRSAASPHAPQLTQPGAGVFRPSYLLPSPHSPTSASAHTDSTHSTHAKTAHSQS